MTVPVSEVYGPVLQGEGPHVGRPVTFLRLGLCNLSCSWCDTPYTWDRTRFNLNVETPQRSYDELRDMLGTRSGTLVLSGGEPVMHRHNVTLRTTLATWEGDVHGETNGTLIPSDWMAKRITWWNVSPKLSHSGDRASKRLKPDALTWFARAAMERRAAFKFVAQTPADLDQVDQLVAEFPIPRHTVWIMPEGVTPQAQLDGMASLEGAVLERGWNLSLRLHVLMHGNQKGI